MAHISVRGSLQVMGEWLKEYTSKLMEAKGISLDDQLPAGGGGDLNWRRGAFWFLLVMAVCTLHCYPSPDPSWVTATQRVPTCQHALRKRGMRSRADAPEADAEPPKPARQQRRLWLTADMASSPGAFGFYRTAHREPLGDCLRLLLDYSLPGAVPPLDGLPQAPESALTVVFFSTLEVRRLIEIPFHFNIM